MGDRPFQPAAQAAAELLRGLYRRMLRSIVIVGASRAP